MGPNYIKMKGISLIKLVILVQLCALQTKARAQDISLATYSNQTEISASGSITLLPGFHIPSGSNVHIYINDQICNPVSAALSTNQNFISTRVFKEPGVNNLNINDARNSCQVNQTVQYFDGLGRPLQTVTVQGSPTFKDIVQPVEYDAFGREAVTYLPYADQGSSNGSYKTNALTTGQGVMGFYNAPPAGVKQTSYPFSKTVFEASPLNRVEQQGAPGTVWQPLNGGIPNSGHTVKTQYKTNVAGEVQIWTVNATGASTTVNYLPGKLYKTVTHDENWASGNAGTIEEFKDFEGRVVLRRIWETEVKKLSTYYVYDDLGNLRYVIPPGVNTLVTLSFTENDGLFKEQVYGYHYDGRKRVTEKKIPGKGWEYMVYNKLDQVVMTQDAEQRLKSPMEWTVTKYDALGRVILTGLFQANGSRPAMQTSVDNQGGTDHWQWERRGATANGYTSDTYPVPTKELTVNYYDNYDDIPGIPSAFILSGHSGMTKGLATASKTNVLGTAHYLWSVSYYDDEGRVAKTLNQHYLADGPNPGNYDEVTNTWSFAGELKESIRIHHTTGGNTTIANRYGYDHMGRKTNTWQKINNGDEVLLSRLSYNQVGQLLKKDLHSSDEGTNFTQSSTYAYNERGWMTEINDPDNITANTIFGMELQYANKPDAFNGNIGGARWQTKVPAGLGLTQPLQSYVYNYDKLNRLEKAEYTTPGALNKFNEELVYDEMGNITSLKRRNNASNYLNQMSYTYTKDGIKTNKLWSVTDAGTAAQASTYLYNENGSQKGDSRKGITIAYNELNLPKTISKASTGETIQYVYDATGNKLRKIFGSSIRNYISGIEYNNGAIDFIMTEEGRAIPGASYTYEYMLKDHLGNTRATVKQNGDIVQVQDYYAFGMDMNPGNNISPSPDNRYKYNGKEKQTELGLDQLDYGARFYDPVIGRWNVIDPLAEKMRRHSPYNYVFNNPMGFIDPDGMDPIYGKNFWGNIKQIGDDGKEAGKAYLVKGSVKRDVKNATKGGEDYSGSLTESSNIMKVPTDGIMGDVIGSVDATLVSQKENGGSSNIGDVKATIWDQGAPAKEVKDADGNVIGAKASISPFVIGGAKNVPTDASNVEFYWHTHPNTTVGGVSLGASTPSDADKAFQGTMQDRGFKGNAFVIGTRGNTVTYYNKNGALITVKYSDFKKMGGK